jgi:amino acid adenylation domain-containing protein
MHPPGADYVAALLGCFYAGVVAVPAYPPRWSRPLHRLVGVVADCRARLALTTQAALERMERQLGPESALAGLTWVASDVVDDGEGKAWRASPESHDALALLQYTSGSTSAPKGVMLSPGHLLRNIGALVERGRATADDRWVTWLPPYHDMGLIGAILLPLCTGMEATLLSPSAFLQRPFRWLSAISRHAATISGGPNFAYELSVRRITAAQRASLDLGAWRVAFSGAERVRAETLTRFTEAFAPAGFRSTAFVPCYGLAEATLAVSFGPIDQPFTVKALDDRALGKGRAEPARPGELRRTLVGCGKPLADCEVIIIDPETAVPLGDRLVGEIWVRSPSVAAGYWGKSALTEQVFRARIAAGHGQTGAGYLRTGDLGFLDTGELFVTGRLKDLIVMRGANHYPEDIEGTIEGCHPALRALGGAAFSIDLEGEERLVIVHEIDPSRAAVADEVAAAVASAVAEGHELSVHEVVLVRPGGVPKTSSGKVQRSRCRELYLGGTLAPFARTRGVARREVPNATSELATRIAGHMAELLGVETVLLDDDFFWLGGHSLLATQLASRLSESLEVDVPLHMVFQAPTPRGLAARIGALPRAAATPIFPTGQKDPPALSFSQERMWFLHQLDPEGAAYNVAGALCVEGVIDGTALERSFQEILKRHEVLRSNYPTVLGAPTLRIAATRDLSLTTVDLSAHETPEPAAIARASDLARAPFDVARDPLVRAALYRLEPERHILAVCMHHLVTDAWSMGVLMRDLLRFYEAFAQGRTPPPDVDRLSYADYAHWQRAALGGDRLAEELSYWKRELEGAEPLLIPCDRPRSQRRSSKGAFLPLTLSGDLLRSLRELGAAHGATLFMVMLAAFEVVLHRHTDQTDLVVGIPVANRNRLASEHLVGTLVNTLALRVRLEPDVTFAALVRRVREVAILAYSHQDLPFERLVSEMRIERRPGVSPLLQVMFDFQNAPMRAPPSSALRMTPVVLSRGGSQFDLSLLILDTELAETAGIEYSTDLFDAKTIERFAEHYASVLASVPVDPHQPISRIALLTRSERDEILERSSKSCNMPAAAPAHERFHEHVTKSPDAPAVVDELGVMSYGELDRCATALGARLRALGAGPGQRVAIFLERSRRLVIALLAAQKAGVAYVPIDPRHPPLRVAFVLEDCEARFVVTERSLEPSLPGSIAASVVCLDADADLASAPGSPSVPPDSGRAAYVMYTSGSTGRPKGVEISVGALANFLRSMSHTPGMVADDRLLSVTTIAFDIAGLELWLPLVTGGSVHIAPSDVVADGHRLARLVDRVAPTIIQATPATWRMLIEAGWRGAGKPKILCGGEELARELADQLLLRGSSVWNMYGPTETTIWSTVHQVLPGEGAVPIGSPIDETRVYVLDRHGELCPMAVPGEICIGGAGVATGYFKRPDLTRERFVSDPFAPAPGARMYRTGDLGRLRVDGTLEHLGRLDHQLKIRGFRIEPGEIESVLKEQAGVGDALVVAREDRRDDVRLVAYYVPTSPDGTPATNLRELLRRRLPEYMVPSAFVALAEFPRTPNGKIDRARLPAPVADHAATVREHVPPSDELETKLVRLWEEILLLRQPSLRDNFFDLGGHSLLAVRLFSRIERELGVAMPLSTLFEAPTIEHLAERIREGRSSLTPSVPAKGGAAASARSATLARPFSSLVLIQSGGERRPLYCVHGAGGNVVNLVGVARHLGTERPFYGFQARGVDGIAEPFARIEDTAAAYLAELRALQPEGPYYLCGYCAGGAIAFEMARLLHEGGQRVAMVALLDTYRPGVVLPTSRVRRLREGIAREGWTYVWRRITSRLGGRIALWVRELRIGYRRLLGKSVPYELRDFWLTRAFFKAVAAYRPRVYPGRLTVMRARDVEDLGGSIGPDLGWTGLASEGIDVHDVPGNHDTLILEPHAIELARALQECLQIAEGTAER